jgi:hypothetical protein
MTLGLVELIHLFLWDFSYGKDGNGFTKSAIATCCHGLRVWQVSVNNFSNGWSVLCALAQPSS